MLRPPVFKPGPPHLNTYLNESLTDLTPDQKNDDVTSDPEGVTLWSNHGLTLNFKTLYLRQEKLLRNYPSKLKQSEI
jgi:hypothetical protein